MHKYEFPKNRPGPGYKVEDIKIRPVIPYVTNLLANHYRTCAKIANNLLESCFDNLSLASIQGILKFIRGVISSYATLNSRYGKNLKINCDTSDIEDFFTSCDVNHGLSAIRGVIDKAKAKGIKYGGISKRVFGGSDVRKRKIKLGRKNKTHFINKYMIDDFANSDKYKKASIFYGLWPKS